MFPSCDLTELCVLCGARQKAFGSRESLNDAGGVEHHRDLPSRERDQFQTDLYLLCELQLNLNTKDTFLGCHNE